MKIDYESVELEVISFENNDVIVTSEKEYAATKA